MTFDTHSAPAASVPGEMPGLSPQQRQHKERELARHKALALGFLLAAAAIYLACTIAEHTLTSPPAWIGFVAAAAEAGMVGGLADWFAVTALFRRPLGLPIPHTAIIKNNKDQIGDQLAGFVRDNFLNAPMISAKLRSLAPALLAATWLNNPQHARTVAENTGQFVQKALRTIDPADAEQILRGAVMDKLAEPNWGPPAGKLVASMLDDGRFDPLIDELAGWIHTKALRSRGFIDRIVEQRAPSWAPRFIGEIAGDKLYREVVNWTREVADNPHHPARDAARRAIAQFADDLQHDPVMIDKVEGIKHDILSSQAATNAPAQLWEMISTSLMQAASDPNSQLRLLIEHQCQHWGSVIAADPQLQRALDERAIGIATFLVDNYGDTVTGIISETIQQWDADEASDIIELMVGKDLQYIRLNGTIVGALAGLVIYTVTYLLFL